MSTETQTTTEQTATTQQSAEAKTAPEKEVTLDDVYRDAGLDKIETQQTQTQQTHQQVHQPQQTKVEPSTVPDPYSEEFKAYMARQAAGTTELQKAVTQIAAHIGEAQKTRMLEITKADIDKAVSTINDVVKHPKPKVIEAALDGMVREDPRLKAIWENRAKNPNAWNNALKIVTKQISEDFSVKVDPSLVAAQRARKDAQKQMATTTDTETSPTEERLAAATGADFDREWERLLGHG